MNKPKRIFVHCTATPEGFDVSASDVDRWHRQRGWSEIGYHALVLLNGQIEHGRPERRCGAHVAGHNKNSLGVAYVGGLASNRSPKDTRTNAQTDALYDVVLDWMLRYDISVDKVFGHYEVANKACPSFSMGPFRTELARRLDDDSTAVDALELQNTVREMQAGLGVKVDGDPGPVTCTALRSALKLGAY